MTADEVRRIGDDEALLIIANYKPIRARRVFWNQPNPAEVGSLGQTQAMVVRALVAPPPPNNITPLRRELKRLSEE